jgi:WD40 repeat protein
VRAAHEDSILSLGIDQSTLVSTSRDHTAKVWELPATDNSHQAELQLRHTLRGHSMAVLAVQLLNGRIYTSSGDKSVRIWDTHSGELIRILEGATSVARFQLREDAAGAQRLLGACTDGTIRLYDTETGAELACLKGHTNVVTSVGFLDMNVADAGHTGLASTSYDGTVRLWAPLEEPMSSWKCISTFSFSDAVVTPRPFPRYTTTDRDSTREERTRIDFLGQEEKAVSRALAMQVSGSHVYCCGESAHIVVWRLTSDRHKSIS